MARRARLFVSVVLALASIVLTGSAPERSKPPPADCAPATLQLERSDSGPTGAGPPTAVLRNTGPVCTMRAQLSYTADGRILNLGPEPELLPAVVGPGEWVSFTLTADPPCPEGGYDDLTVHVGGPEGIVLTDFPPFGVCPGRPAIGWTVATSRGGPREYPDRPTNNAGAPVSGPRVALTHRLPRSVALTGPLALYGGPPQAGTVVLMRPKGTTTVLTAARERNYSSPALPAGRGFTVWAVSGGMCIGGVQAAALAGNASPPDLLPSSGRSNSELPSDLQDVDGGSDASVAASSDGRTIAAGYGDNSPECPVHDIRVRTADGTQRVWHTSGSSDLTVLALDGDGHHLAWASSSGLHVATLGGTSTETGVLDLDAASRAVPLPRCVHKRSVQSATWQRDELLVIASCGNEPAALLRVDSVTGTVRRITLPVGLTPMTVSAASDGSLLVLASHPASGDNDLLMSGATGPLAVVARGLAWTAAAW